MPPRTKTSTTKLPQSLREQIDADNTPHHGTRKRQHKVSRKESRKQERAGQKQRKAQFFSVGVKRPAVAEEHHESPTRKKVKLDPEPVLSAPVQPPKPKKAPAKPALSAPRLAKPPEKPTEEDAYITYLESKLGYSKGKGKKTEDDGLDDLLDFTSSLAFSQPLGIEEETSSEDEDDSDEDEWQGIAESENESASEKSSPVPELRDPETRYIPPHLRNAERGTASDSEEIVKLTRQLKGLLNRTSEQNIESILDNVEELYRNNRRNDVTSTLTTMIIDGISSHSSLLDSYVVLYAAFVSSLHKLIGVEFAAHFVQNVVASYERYHNNLGVQDEELVDGHDTRGKECSNLIVLLSELYNFQVISCLLVFDVIRGLLEVLTEFNVELLLKIVRNSGQQLRQDDPSALKDIIDIVQNKMSVEGDKTSSRTRFMIETLTNLKNNKLKRNVTQNQGGEAVERMKKFLTSLGKKRHVLVHEPLRVSLSDLHSADSKGKWWLVGSAWGGDPLVERQTTRSEQPSAPTVNTETDILLKLARKQGMNTDIRRSIFVVLMSSDDYVDACERLSQLNLTEVQQRDIIRVLLHCCGNEKTYNPYYTLVCQHLCRSSHSYKITLQFCLWDFLRDLGEAKVGGAEVIKNAKDVQSFDLKSISSSRMKNVAKAYGWWIAKDCVKLGIFKPLDFTVLQPRTRQFLVDLFSHLYISSQVTTPLMVTDSPPTERDRKLIEDIFSKAAVVPALSMGLAYILADMFRTNEDGTSEGLWSFLTWANELAVDTLRSTIRG
ncbi:hypothetical protein C8J56DRAFT_495127 [Mycena floridula]|nr:hypothetical protein C8J56DRAFT_495127 [Mycena floridula]